MTSTGEDVLVPATEPTVAGQRLQIEGVRHVYGSNAGDVVALAGIDLEIDAGAFVTVVGPSGCGKTTLLQAIAGFITPTHGAISVGGRRIEGPGSDRGVVFQHPTSLYPWWSVRKNVELGLRVRRIPRAERRARALAELEHVGLADFAERNVDELSGGMQQRCQIARVLANDPDVMLMDEPFGALDALTREQLQDQIRNLWRETRRTVVLITHSVDEAVLLGTRVIVMSPRPGEVVLDLPVPFSQSEAPSHELRSHPDVVAASRLVRETIAGPPEANASR
jgi:ABC-type nitrate/sulfonate/bicarbonate transport system ATPase subunit